MRESHEEAREAALRILERRRRTRKEMERRLSEKRFSSEIIRTTLDRLQEVGLVNDREYARIFLRERLARRRAMGERLIRRQLGARGIAPAVIEEVLGELLQGESDSTDSVDSEIERGRRALHELSRKTAGVEAHTRRRRISAALVRRGFGYDLISQLLAELERSESNKETATG